MTPISKKTNTSTFPWGDQLVLFRYFLNLFGKNSLASLGGRLNNSEFEGIGEDGNTYFFKELDQILERQGNEAKLSRDTLRLYDEHIIRYVKQIGEKRDGINLKYFQYIACLFTEIYLDFYFNRRDEFIKDLNQFVQKTKDDSFNAIDIEPFTLASMNKLAFMCATGSGKTLIMHINILQFQYYLKKAKIYKPHIGINKIIVLAPNEGMANQHLDELKLSQISADAFIKDGFGSTADVIVIDMNKLKEEGKVKTVSVDSFEQNNLVLVDEAHRGLAGDVWFDYRSRLSADADKGGFAFEYSATLKQAMKTLTPKTNMALLDEYFRSIIIDYSYKFFYEDGYGKEYRIYNLRDSINEEQRQLYLLGCLLSFYQQLKLFTEKGKEFSAFHIEKPLLVFVGNRVTARTSKSEMTDVEEVLHFIDTFAKDRQKAINRIHTLLYGSTGLMDSAGRELFAQNFNALISIFGEKPKAEDVYQDILRLVFNSDTSLASHRLHILDLRQVPGEIALRMGSDGEYFGVISIGDTSGLIKNCEAKGIVTSHEEFASESLFRTINDRKSNINILVGSRKFSEGWNSWRVSTMGLINFAKGEGSQAIQLFGRGVRLWGYDKKLKRSNKLDDSSLAPPKNIELLETLTIFGIKAQYMEDFKKYLEMEELPNNEKLHEYILPIISRYNSKEHKKLRIVKVQEGKVFKKQAARILLDKPDEDFGRRINKNKVVIDCRSKVQTLSSTKATSIGAVQQGFLIQSEFIPFLDFERILNELEIYKSEKSYYNIALTKDGIEAVLEIDGWYSLIIPDTHIHIDSMEKLSLATDLAIMLLKSYLDKFYKYEKDKWESPFLEYQELDDGDSNFVSEYKLSYYEAENAGTTSEAIAQFVDDLTVLMKKNAGFPDNQYTKTALNDALVAFDFRSHLYAPLICLKANGLQLTISPVSLNEGEKNFVDKLKNYIDNNRKAFEGKSLYLLRNKSKAGMGFFEAGNFYPDFVLWVDSPEKQYISFVDPKGLRHLQWTDEKIEFYSTIKKLEAQLKDKQGTPEKPIVLNSFIMSSTNSADLQIWWDKNQEERRSKNVFCLDETDCIDGMMEKIFTSYSPSTVRKVL